MRNFNISLFRDTPTNVALINESSKGTIDATDPIAAFSIGNGTITVNNSNQKLITGVGTAFISQIQPNDYISNLDNVVIGQVDTVDSDTQITLKENRAFAITSASSYLFNRNGSFLNNESFLMRVQVIKEPTTNTVIVPSIFNLRTGNSSNASANTNTSFIKMERITNFGNSGLIISPINIPCTITQINTKTQGTGWFSNFPITTSDFQYNQGDNVTQAQFFDFLWYRVNPFGATTENLLSGTTNNLIISDVLPSITFNVGVNGLANDNSIQFYSGSNRIF